MNAIEATQIQREALYNWQRDPSPENFAVLCFSSGQLAAVAITLQRELERREAEQ